MKKLITLLLAAAMLAASVPAAFAGETLDALTLDSASPLTVAADGYIDNMADGTTAAELAANFKDKQNVTVTSKSGKALTLADPVGSDATVSYVSGDVIAKTWMMGDVNGDAAINAKDPAILVKKQAGFSVELCDRAADVNCDGAVNAKDVAQMLKYVAGWAVTIEKPAYAGELAPNEDAGIGMYFTNIMNRIGRSDTSNHGSLDYVARMAKNEIEDIEIVLTSDADKSGMTLEVGEFTNENGATLDYTLHVGYYYSFDMFNQLKGKDYGNITNDYWVDPLLYLRGSFDLAQDQSLSFAVRITSTADTEAGFYKAPVCVKDAEGNVVKQGTLRVYVWNIVLDETPALGTAFDLDYAKLVDSLVDIPDGERYSEKTLRPIFEEWYEYLVENHISPYKMPISPEDSRNAKYVNDPRVTSFCAVGGGAGNENTPLDSIVDMWNRHLDDPVWLDKAYIYTVDEPGQEWQIEVLEKQWAYLNEKLPGVPHHVICPGGNKYNHNGGEDEKDFFDRVSHSTDMMCPINLAFNKFVSREEKKADPDMWPNYYTSDYVTDRFVYEKYGDFATRYEKLREEGKIMWNYICIAPEFPYANFFIYYPGVDIRMVLWQTYQNNCDGLLYWATNYWQRDEKDNRPITLKKTHASGDGLLIYTGAIYGQGNIPVPSIRFESVRDGIEDYQYMRQLEREIGREAVLDYVERVSTHLLRFSEDPNDIVSTRSEIAFLLESLAK